MRRPFSSLAAVWITEGYRHAADTQTSAQPAQNSEKQASLQSTKGTNGQLKTGQMDKGREEHLNPVFGQLGRHVHGGPHSALVPLSRLGVESEAEVDDLDVSVRCQQDVFRLQVMINYARLSQFWFVDLRRRGGQGERGRTKDGGAGTERLIQKLKQTATRFYMEASCWHSLDRRGAAR